METKFNTNGTTVDVFNINPDQITSTLVPKVYEVAFNKMRGFYLTIIADSFTVDDKVYGNTQSRIDKIMNTYSARSVNTGVILSGDKGTGKSLLSQLLGNTCINNKMPVILIQEPYNGSEFISFINSLGSCLFILDEFVKTYKVEGKSVQDRLLTLFDGAISKTSNNKSIFLVIDNNKRGFDEFMLDRTGRFFYHFEYGKLPDDVIVEYCIENTVEQSIIDDILDVASKRTKFGYDLLKSIVEEHKRYPTDSIDSLITDMNISSDSTVLYTLVSVKDSNNKSLKINPLYTPKPRIGGYMSNVLADEIDESNDDWIDESHLVYSKGIYRVYKTSHFTLIFEVTNSPIIDYRNLL